MVVKMVFRYVTGLSVGAQMRCTGRGGRQERSLDDDDHQWALCIIQDGGGGMMGGEESGLKGLARIRARVNSVSSAPSSSIPSHPIPTCASSPTRRRPQIGLGGDQYSRGIRRSILVLGSISRDQNKSGPITEHLHPISITRDLCDGMSWREESGAY